MKKFIYAQLFLLTMVTGIQGIQQNNLSPDTVVSNTALNSESEDEILKLYIAAAWLPIETPLVQGTHSPILINSDFATVEANENMHQNAESIWEEMTLLLQKMLLQKKASDKTLNFKKRIIRKKNHSLISRPNGRRKSRRTYLHTHIATKHENRETCSLCQNVTEHENREKTCSLCQKMFASKQLCREHVECVHNGKGKCPECGKISTSSNNLKMHITRMHSK